MLCATLVAAQTKAVKGVVTDSKTKQPVAFAIVSLEGRAEGAIADIDGRFTLKIDSLPASIIISFLGYETQFINLTPADTIKTLEVRLKPSQYEIKEVVVRAGPNPAVRIIEKAVENRDRNDPYKLDAYSYTTYNKLVLKGEADSNKVKAGDTSAIKAAKFFGGSHFFMLETTTEKKFLAPNSSNEFIVGVRASGFQDPTFLALAAQLQEFSFYKELIDISSKTYLNPISKNAENKYVFILQDTLYERTDSIFVISFEPRKGKNFEGLQGVVYINNNGWAIQNVIAKPADPDGPRITLQQKYELIDGQRWFPVQLNTDIEFRELNIASIPLKGEGRTYLKNIKVNPPLKKSDFISIDIILDPDAIGKPEGFWNTARGDSLDDRETRTYQLIDSLGKAQKFDKRLRTLTTLSSGKIPYKFLDFDIDQIIRFNNHEGVRIGLGAHTNTTLSKVFAIGGYAGYGFRDNEFKWGADAEARLWKKPGLRLKVLYQSDVLESGMPIIRGMGRIDRNEQIRNTQIRTMDFVNRAEVNVTFRTPGYLRWVAFANRSQVETRYNYNYVPNPTNGVGINNYVFTEAGLSARFAYDEELFDAGKAIYSLGTKYPVLYVQYTQGLQGVLGGEYAYQKVDIRLTDRFKLKNLGTASFMLLGGYATGQLPYFNLYAQRANYIRPRASFLSSEYSFEAMRMNEFLADRYVALFLRHDFENLLFKSKGFNPRPVLVHNMAYGALANPQRQQGIDFTPLDKLYIESGLLLNNLYILNRLSGVGLGAFYRYGAYSRPQFIDNFVAKLSFTLNF